MKLCFSVPANIHPHPSAPLCRALSVSPLYIKKKCFQLYSFRRTLVSFFLEVKTYLTICPGVHSAPLVRRWDDIVGFESGSSWPSTEPENGVGGAPQDCHSYELYYIHRARRSTKTVAGIYYYGATSKLRMAWAWAWYSVQLNISQFDF